jgi:hypothetical protein
MRPLEFPADRDLARLLPRAPGGTLPQPGRGFFAHFGASGTP